MFSSRTDHPVLSRKLSQVLFPPFKNMFCVPVLNSSINKPCLVTCVQAYFLERLPRPEILYVPNCTSLAGSLHSSRNKLLNTPLFALVLVGHDVTTRCFPKLEDTILEPKELLIKMETSKMILISAICNMRTN